MPFAGINQPNFNPVFALLQQLQRQNFEGPRMAAGQIGRGLESFGSSIARGQERAQEQQIQARRLEANRQLQRDLQERGARFRQEAAERQRTFDAEQNKLRREAREREARIRSGQEVPGPGQDVTGAGARERLRADRFSDISDVPDPGKQPLAPSMFMFPPKEVAEAVSRAGGAPQAEQRRPTRPGPPKLTEQETEAEAEGVTLPTSPGAIKRLSNSGVQTWVNRILKDPGVTSPTVTAEGDVNDYYADLYGQIVTSDLTAPEAYRLSDTLIDNGVSQNAFGNLQQPREVPTEFSQFGSATSAVGVNRRTGERVPFHQLREKVGGSLSLRHQQGLGKRLRHVFKEPTSVGQTLFVTLEGAEAVKANPALFPEVRWEFVKRAIAERERARAERERGGQR